MSFWSSQAREIEPPRHKDAKDPQRNFFKIPWLRRGSQRNHRESKEYPVKNLGAPEPLWFLIHQRRSHTGNKGDAEVFTALHTSVVAAEQFVTCCLTRINETLNFQGMSPSSTLRRCAFAVQKIQRTKNQPLGSSFAEGRVLSGVSVCLIKSEGE